MTFPFIDLAQRLGARTARAQRPHTAPFKRLDRSASVMAVGGWEFAAGDAGVRCTPAALHLLGGMTPTGAPPHAIPLASLGQLFGAHDRRRLIVAAAHALRAEGGFEVELRSADGRGGWRWIRIVGAARTDGSAQGLHGVVQDIHAQRLDAMALDGRDPLAHALPDAAPDPMLVVNAATRTIRHASPAAQALLRGTSDSAGGGDWMSAVHSEDRAHVASMLARAGRRDPSASGRFRIVAAGQTRWLEGHACSVVAAHAGEPIAVCCHDVTKQQGTEARLARLATHDATTELPNRAALTYHVERVLARCREGGEHAHVVLLDIDDFKRVNDIRGHEFGDQALRAIGGRLLATLQPGELLYRFSGDTFAILGRAATPLASPNRYLDALEAPFEVAGQRVHVSASAGLASFPEDARTAATLVAAADAAMYAAKASGPRAWRRYLAPMTESMVRTDEAHRTLLEALERQTLLLHYQPRVMMATGRVVGFEALLRRRTPTGVVSAGPLIGVAEDFGLIERLGAWVLREASAQSRMWRKAGLTVPIAVNISARQLFGHDLLPLLRGLIASDARIGAHVELELTESTLAAEPNRTTSVLRQIAGMGFRLHLDDFGTGYSSLAYLARFPIHSLKIDQSFVAGLGTGDRRTQIVQTIVQLASSLGLHVIAEGVETRDQAEQLLRLGCEEAQGYLFAPALDPRAALAFAASRSAKGARAGTAAPAPARAGSPRRTTSTQ